MQMTADAFIAKWRAAKLTERAAAQSHFIDLCRLLDEPAPADADPSGTFYAFERGATKTTGGDGWADVWKRGHFGWEYKGKRKDLNAAFVQLQQYALALENPPLLVTCDLERFVIRTNWTNTVSETHELALEDLRDAAARDVLKAVLSDPERLRPGVTRQGLTEKAAADFAALARRLRDRGHAPQTVAHFVNRLVFCMFAEDVGLLPNGMFSRMLDAAAHGGDFGALAGTLFRAMREGGMVGFERVEWFNGGLFDTDEALPLDAADVELCRKAAALDWGEIDPSILGTLFERGLDPHTRAELGAHYTDRDKIMRMVEPVIVRPLLAEWEAAKAGMAVALDKPGPNATPAARTRARAVAEGLYRGFLDRVRGYRVLDPACGSGNFLYLALRALKDLEHRAGLEAEALGLQREFPAVGPESVLGLELNPYAAELARVTVWIGEIQWMRRNGFDVSRQPILRPLDNIECRDAALGADGRRAQWPKADAIIGNPPFLSDKVMRGTLGDAYAADLRSAYSERVPGGADLVAYWVANAWAKVAGGEAERAGLVTTNSIRGGANRRVLEPTADAGGLFEAWSDEPWVQDGAAVRVSLLCFAGQAAPGAAMLDGHAVERINADLTGAAADLTQAKPLRENVRRSFIGDQKTGAFDVPGALAREWLSEPLNPNGRPNADVLRPWANGMDMTRRPSGRWIVDFGNTMPEGSASFYERPFAHVERHVRPARAHVKRDNHRRYWWLHGEPRPGMRAALAGLERYIATPRVAKHRLFVWMPAQVLPDCQLVVIARSDDCAFGVLHSRFHEAWALRMGTALEDRPRYTPSTTFETFPFPPGMTPDMPAAALEASPEARAIGAAAAVLDRLRNAWLNPPDLVRVELEVAPGYPDRVLPRDEAAAAVLAKRTLTNLYNARPAWLANAHAELDSAVAAAYGWPADIGTDDALERLLALNLERAAAGGG